MPNKYKLAVFIGRFQPFHIGHLHAVTEALKIADHILILVGSADKAATPKNPWEYDIRAEMILASVRDSFAADRISISPLRDNSSESEWIAGVQRVVSNLAEDLGYNQSSDVCLVGHEKDATSYYLKIFPQWKFQELGFFGDPGSRCIDATKVREFFFEGMENYATGVLHPEVFKILKKWSKTEKFSNLQKEYEYLKAYRKSWEAAPYPPIFVTVDAVIVQSGHVLLIERGGFPGNGLWALPGGFVNQNERIVDAMIREVMEETNLKLQIDVLSRCLAGIEVFDNPGRSQRGRTISHAGLFRLDDSKPLPKIKAGDDAAKVIWVPFSEIKHNGKRFFEDHHDIVTTMLRKDNAFS